MSRVVSTCGDAGSVVAPVFRRGFFPAFAGNHASKEARYKAAIKMLRVCNLGKNDF
jgi:hypothetical protein